MSDETRNDPFDIPFLRSRMLRHGAIQLTALVGKHAVFFRDSGGKVYADRMGMDLSRQVRCNDTDRRAWCALAGVKLKDLREMVKAERQRAEAEEIRIDTDFKVRSLEARGYRITKRRKAKGA